MRKKIQLATQVLKPWLSKRQNDGIEAEINVLEKDDGI